MSDLTRSMLEAYAAAETQGAEVIAGEPSLLLVDLDTEEARTRFKKILPVLKEHFGVVQVNTWVSKSGNTHKWVKLGRELPASYRIALQAVLGSDPVRELLGIRRLELGIDEPSLLFQPKGAQVTEEDVTKIPDYKKGRKFFMEDE